MATIDMTNRFLNQDKRYTEAVVVTVPSILKNGGGRSNALPEYLQGGDTLTARVIEPDTFISKAFVNVIEAFPAGAVADITIDGTLYFTAVDLTATGVVVSLVEDLHYWEKQNVEVVVSGITGDVLTGKLAVVFDTIHSSLKNGQYAN